MKIVELLESWEKERKPLVLEGSLAASKSAAFLALGKRVALDERMAVELERRGIRRGGYTLPALLELSRKASRQVLGVLEQWREERGKLDAAEALLPSCEERYPIAKIKNALDTRVLVSLEALGVPVWGLQIETAIQAIEAVCAEAGGRTN